MIGRPWKDNYKEPSALGLFVTFALAGFVGWLFICAIFI